MTCIVGYVHGGTVYIGGDSAGVDENLSTVVRGDLKVFAIDGFLFGFAGSFRVGQVVRYGIEMPARVEGQSLDAYMVCGFADAMRGCLARAGALRASDGVEEMDAEFLVGTEGRLFCVQADLQVGETRLEYHAIGSGSDVALGCLHALNGKGTPGAKIEKALAAAAEFNAGVRGPFVVERTG